MRLADHCLHIHDIKHIAVQCEVFCSGNNGSSKHRLKLGPGLKPLHRMQASARSGRLAKNAAYTARRLRPFARRAAITARPPRVFMRVKKPCVRARLTLEGWYVRFMMVLQARKLPLQNLHTLQFLRLVILAAVQHSQLCRSACHTPPDSKSITTVDFLSRVSPLRI